MKSKALERIMEENALRRAARRVLVKICRYCKGPTRNQVPICDWCWTKGKR